MRILAIGDIHGQLTMLEALLQHIAPTDEDRVIFLGDYVDRGPDSRGVIARVRELVHAGKAIALRGNHEIMMLESHTSPDYFESWRRYGGLETIASYAPPGRAGQMSDIPEADYDFLWMDCRPYYETGTHIFVHAGASPSVEMEDQDDLWLYWEKLDHPAPHRSQKVVICGHTKQRNGRPLDKKHTICIDTGAYSEGGWLTCLEVMTGHYWQVNSEGEIRDGWVSAPRQA